MRATLVPLDGGPPFDLAKDLTLVGRNEDCDLRLDHKSVSKLHCILVRTEGLILVRDLGSTNGTRVNGQRVRRAALLPNDNLAIATFRYKVSFGEPAVEPETDAANGQPPAPDVLRRNTLPDDYPS
jgi:pSer/pThr/pTyr-binding forkhead associated (FHA) protein